MLSTLAGLPPSRGQPSRQPSRPVLHHILQQVAKDCCPWTFRLSWPRPFFSGLVSTCRWPPGCFLCRSATPVAMRSRSYPAGASVASAHWACGGSEPASEPSACAVLPHGEQARPSWAPTFRASPRRLKQGAGRVTGAASGCAAQVRGGGRSPQHLPFSLCGSEIGVPQQKRVSFLSWAIPTGDSPLPFQCHCFSTARKSTRLKWASRRKLRRSLSIASSISFLTPV